MRVMSKMLYRLWDALRAKGSFAKGRLQSDLMDAPMGYSLSLSRNTGKKMVEVEDQLKKWKTYYQKDNINQ